MNETPAALRACDREPIHIPGSIQPHGLMLVVDRNLLTVVHAAGNVEERLQRPDWLGRSVADLVTDTLANRIARVADSNAGHAYIGQLHAPSGEVLDVSAIQASGFIVVELEPGPAIAAPGSAVLGALEAAASAFERTVNLSSLCQRAALEFRRLTGFDRVLVYQFLDESAGAVLAEDRAPELPSFLNHHFPGSDVPPQARALYVRNLVRVIPDASYAPALLRPAWNEGQPLDMSDCALRSVAPVHLQYLKNMGVGASASISIVKDGVLWGLIACHHMEPRLLTYDVRVACRVLAGGLSRQIRAKEEAAGYRERIRMRGFEDALAGSLSQPGPLDAALAAAMPDMREMLGADGLALHRAGEVRTVGACPPPSELKALSGWVAPRSEVEPFATDRLSSVGPEPAASSSLASGLLAITVAPDEPFVLMWFRAEHVEVVNWAGNPHANAGQDPSRPLSPRASFEAWSETVRGRSRPWTAAEVEQASRLRRILLDVRQSRRLHELNERLSETLSDKDSLLQQKEFLLKEVNHRVQNSLQLVSSFLGLQARASEDTAAKAHLDEAQRRLSAVALVHRRLYRADQVEAVDLSRYIEDLCAEMLSSMGVEWRGELVTDLAPVTISADRAVTLGLVLTELVINANKYAYGGAPGPVEIALSQQGRDFRLVVADRGGGKHHPGQGFGTRMMNAMVAQLSGAIDYQDNHPGLRAVLTAPV